MDQRLAALPMNAPALPGRAGPPTRQRKITCQANGEATNAYVTGTALRERLYLYSSRHDRRQREKLTEARASQEPRQGLLGHISPP